MKKVIGIAAWRDQYKRKLFTRSTRISLRRKSCRGLPLICPWPTTGAGERDVGCSGRSDSHRRADIFPFITGRRCTKRFQRG